MKIMENEELSQLTNSGQAWTAWNKKAGGWRERSPPPIANNMICVAIPHDDDTLLFGTASVDGFKKGVGGTAPPMRKQRDLYKHSSLQAL